MRHRPSGVTLDAASVFGGAASKGAFVNMVVVRFHHPSRDLDEIESTLVQAGAQDAAITGYTVVLTFNSGSPESAGEAARQMLDRIGATHIKVRRSKHGPKQHGSDAGSEGRRENYEGSEATANLMAKVKMDAFGHP